MKRWLVCFALLGAALLVGCTSSGLGDRVSVKAVYVEKERRYEARLLVLEATPNADTGQVSEQARCLSGSGGPCLLYTYPSPRDGATSRIPSCA